MNRKQRKAAKMIYVNIYDADRAYGGPEEGGWWYDTGWPLDNQRAHGGGTFFNPARAWDHAQAINDALRAREVGISSRDPRSVLYRGRIEAHVERHPAQAFPQERPYYC